MIGSMAPQLLLDPEPQSVRRARRWVVESLASLGRDDLVDSAELGVSELVTNAILHADPPITVRVSGTIAHPRVEVQDRSPHPPAIDTAMAADDHLLRTVGRGVGIVALYSVAWGADVSPDGKVVWFEPADEAGAVHQSEGSVFDLGEAVGSRLAAAAEPGELRQVRLVGMPVRLFAGFRVWYAEIRRELRLLSLAHPEDYPVASALSELTLQVEQDRARARGIEALDAAIAAGQERIDLDYRVTPSTTDTMGRIDELLDRVEEFSREHSLLTVPPTPQQVQLRRWYLGEFVRQGAGEQPAPWPGSYALEPPPP